MKRLILISCLLATASTIYAQQPDFPSRKLSGLSGPYLGQKPPGITPEIFAPGIVSTASHEFSCSFTPDGKEFYFARREPKLNRNLIMVTKIVNGFWTQPEVAPFIENRLSFEPRVTPDGKRLYFTFEKPVPNQSGPAMNIWYVEREGDDWSTPQNPGEPFNPMKTMCVSATRDGTIYTTDISDGPGKECIAVARKVKGQYQQLERLGPPINVGKQDMYPFIAPDESYLLLASKRPAGEINSGLFISFRKKDGNWSDPKAIDLGLQAGLPIISPDEKFLFFTAGERGKSDIYWVDARIIQDLRPKKTP